MTLHTPDNKRDKKSFTHNWQENFYQIEIWLQKNYQALKDLVKESKLRAEKPYPEVESGEDIFIIGTQGAAGPRGLSGQIIFLEGEPGEDAIMVPGQKGADGSGPGGGLTQAQALKLVSFRG